MAYSYVCESCRRALNLPAERSYLNKIKKRAAAPSPEIVQRDATGKPWLLGRQLSGCYEMSPAACVCVCVPSGHDALQCSEEGDFKVGGRPGSGFVDHLAKELGREPIPELAIARDDECQVLVRAILAWLCSSTDDEQPAREAELEGMRYEDQVKLLRDFITEMRADLLQERSYRDLKMNLMKLTRFRNTVAHSRPVGGDHLNRVKREKGKDIWISVTPEELAAYLDLSMQLQSQLSSLPAHLTSRPSTVALGPPHSATTVR
ncbi:hypothetical protein ABZU53_14230 [Micromonospora sp. NPDC005194]|uniref:hypothetical protein n=1 Tax=Micromonospora sp. NPDC005194 TaxID=3156870 RepID=UPI0033AFF311